MNNIIFKSEMRTQCSYSWGAERTPMSTRLSIQSNIDIDIQSGDCMSKNSLTSNNMLVNDYLYSRIHNVVCKDLDMNLIL